MFSHLKQEGYREALAGVGLPKQPLLFATQDFVIHGKDCAHPHLSLQKRNKNRTTEDHC